LAVARFDALTQLVLTQRLAQTQQRVQPQQSEQTQRSVQTQQSVQTTLMKHLMQTQRSAQMKWFA